MRKIFLLSLVAAVITSCTKTNDYDLKGTFSTGDHEGKMIYLQVPEASGYSSIDSSRVTDGKFEFVGAVDTLRMLYVAIQGVQRVQPFVAGEGNVEMSIDSIGNVTVKGTALNDKYQGYLDKRASLQKEMQEKGRAISEEMDKAKAENRVTPEFEKEIESKYEALMNDVRSYPYTFAKENMNNVVGQYVFLDRGRSFDLKQLEEIMPMAGAGVKNDPRYGKIEKRFTALTTTTVGQKYTDLKASDPEGNPIALSDYVGKSEYVLLDFWASWCPPCRRDMPEVVKIYDQYKDKGLQIVGISLDRNREDWVKGIEELNITWPQMSDLKYWETDLGAAYAVNSIPHMVLIDKSGTIVARQFTPAELSARLSESLK